MADYKERIDALAALMEEFRLSEAALEGDDFRVAFRRRSAPVVAMVASGEPAQFDDAEEADLAEAPVAEKISGTPIASPMNGIFYLSSSPSAPPFVREGEEVIAGQTIGLIEAMKVFNEIPSPVSGVVKKVFSESGALVQPGDVLMIVGS